MRDNQTRLQWFAFDVDAFLDDVRMQQLTIKEKSAWAIMIIKSFRNQGMICTDPLIVAEQTALTKKEALALLGKLYNSKLIIPTEDIYTAYSPRMVKEYESAQNAYTKRQKAGIESAKKNGINNLISRHVSERVSGHQSEQI